MSLNHAMIDYQVTKIDNVSWYVNDYLVWNSRKDGWRCECMDFLMKVICQKVEESCKHIDLVKSQIE